MNRLQQLLADRNRSIAMRGQGARSGLTDTLLGALASGIGATAGPEALSYINAVSNRLQGGPPLDPYLYPPMPTGMARPLGGRYAPRTPGLTAETLEPGDTRISFQGDPKAYRQDEGHFRRRAREGNPYENWRPTTSNERAYNLRNEEGEIIASANRVREYPHEAYVPEMWVREDYRKTPAMFDLYNLLSRGGRDTLSASFANKRLQKVFNKRMERMGKKKPRGEINPLDDPDFGEPTMADHEQFLASRPAESSDDVIERIRARQRRLERIGQQPEVPRESALLRQHNLEQLNIDPFALSAAERAEQNALRSKPPLSREEQDARIMARLGLPGRMPNRQVTNRDMPRGSTGRRLAPTSSSQPLRRPPDPTSVRFAVQDSRMGVLQREIEALERAGRAAVAERVANRRRGGR